MQEYRVPDGTTIGHVHLKVSDLQQSLDFYCKLLGFEVMATYGDRAAFISAGGYHHHIGLNTWFSKNSEPPQNYKTGLFHVALLYPTRKDLAIICKRLLDANYPITGSADHGVSEAIYINDPDENGIELYWDRPQGQWKYLQDGSVEMLTNELKITDLLKELDD